MHLPSIQVSKDDGPADWDRRCYEHCNWQCHIVVQAVHYRTWKQSARLSISVFSTRAGADGVLCEQFQTGSSLEVGAYDRVYRALISSMLRKDQSLRRSVAIRQKIMRPTIVLHRRREWCAVGEQRYPLIPRLSSLAIHNALQEVNAQITRR